MRLPTCVETTIVCGMVNVRIHGAYQSVEYGLFEAIGSDVILIVDGRIDSRDQLDIMPSDTQPGAEEKERLSRNRRQERRTRVGSVRGHNAGVTRLHLAINQEVRIWNGNARGKGRELRAFWS